MDTQTETALGSFRKYLLKLKPTGPKGFEGLVADAMADLTGLVIRLAKSGLQGGRDGSSTPDKTFAVALECKRYKDDLRLENLVGKVEIACQELGGDIDVWALGATSEVGDDTLMRLRGRLEEKGITLLALDWTAHPLPPLAVFLAAAKSATLQFFNQHVPKVSNSELSGLLNTIAADSTFAQQAEKLKKELSEAHVGLDALREKNAKWLQDRFHGRGLSRQTFGQNINIKSAFPRERFSRQLDDLVQVDPDDIPLVAVLGDEGTGKTWLVAQWWANLTPPPIMLLVAGPRVEHLLPGRPIESLARLLADQDGRSDEANINSWRRRLGRWKAHEVRDKRRFIIVLDGLNERTTFPWADTLNGLAREAQALGGLVIITSRKAYWERDVRPRLESLAIRQMFVGDYDDQELAAVLKTAGRNLDDLSPNLKEFIRNPRICSVALNLLDRIDQPVEMTRERLLLEYWQARLKERGNGIAHTLADFKKLLQSHAKSWLHKPYRSFDRDEWTNLSGAAKRLGPENVRNDLCEIDEGRFLTISEHDSNTYEFRKEALPYALGLLINNELKEEAHKDHPDFNEELDRILDPVRGFDLVSEILVAAAGLACLDESFPDTGRRSLIRAWLGLQNIPDAVVDAMCAYLAVRPGPFLDIAESPVTELGSGMHVQTLVSMIIFMRDNPAVRSALEVRFPRWLGFWSRNPRKIFRDDAKERDSWPERRRERIDLQLGAFHPEELDLFNRMTFEISNPTDVQLDNTAALLLASRPQAQYAKALLGWSMVQVVARDYFNAYDELRWVVILNRIDWAETKTEVLSLIAHVNEKSSEPMRDSAALVLRLLGDRSSAEWASSLSPRTKGRTLRSVERYCDTNPYDPNAPEGSNLANALEAAKTLSLDQIQSSFGVTSDDHRLKEITPALARFRPQAIVEFFRAVAATTSSRSGMALRQMSLLLYGISPLFDDATLEAVFHSLDTVIANPSSIATGDERWIVSWLARAIMPHLSAEQQLDLLLRLPPDVPLSLQLAESFTPLPSDILSDRLNKVFIENNSEQLKRIIFFAASCRHEFNEVSRNIIIHSIFHNDDVTVMCAADAILNADDSQLDIMLLDAIQKLTIKPDSTTQQGLYIGRAVAVAVIKHRRLDMLYAIPPAFLGYVAKNLGGQAIDHLASYIDSALIRLLAPVSAQPSQDFTIVIDTSPDELTITRSVEEARKESTSRELNDQSHWIKEPANAIRRFDERQEELAAAAKKYECDLRLEEAEAVISKPPFQGLKNLVAKDPSKVKSWLSTILIIKDDWQFSQVRNLGIVLAGAYAAIEPETARRVFQIFKDPPFYPSANIVVGEVGVPLYDHSLFSAELVPELEPLRRIRFEDAFDDAALEQATVAADSSDAGEWLISYVQQLTDSGHPGKQARGLTITGLMPSNPASEHILSLDWGDGFLGDVAGNARKNYQRAGWARTWLEKAGASKTGIDFWRFCQLAQGVADVRALKDFNAQAVNSRVFDRFGRQAKEKLKNAVKKRTEKRKETLFGEKKPDTNLILLLRDILLREENCQ